MLCKDTMHIRINTTQQFESFEYIACSLFNIENVRIDVIYYPPPSVENKLTPALFFEEFSVFPEPIILSPGKLLISDHSAIQSTLYLNKPHFTKKSLVVFRSMRSLEAESLRTDIANCSLCHDLRNYDINA